MSKMIGIRNSYVEVFKKFAQIRASTVNVIVIRNSVKKPKIAIFSIQVP